MRRTMLIKYRSVADLGISIIEAIEGGHSDPRNVTLMKMINLLDIGERAGSGIPSIFAVWREQGWQQPEYTEAFDPDRTITKLALQKVTDDSSDEKQAHYSSGNITDNVRDVRLVGLDRGQKKELILKHIKNSGERGAPLNELQQVLPGHSRSQIQVLLRELKDENRILLTGKTKGAKWIATD
jgi:predicted HTH transcriptional regulator